MERAGLAVLVDFPAKERLNGCGVSERFNTITAIFPSGFKKAVVSSLSVEDELIMRLAPGRMNFEKWPI